jgi:Tol biopolymer transport system component
MSRSLPDALRSNADAFDPGKPNIAQITRKGQARRRRRALGGLGAGVLATLAVGLPLLLLRGLDRGTPDRQPAATGSAPIAFVDARHRIALMQADGTGAIQITNGHEPDAYQTKYGFSIDVNPQWSADGRHIYFLRRYGEAITSLCEVDASGEGFRVLIRDFPAQIFALSPDGRELAYGTSAYGHPSGVYVMATDGSDERRIARYPHLPNGVSIAWSPDGQSLAFVSWRYELWKVTIATGDLQRLSPYPVGGVVWAPSTSIAFGLYGGDPDHGAFPRWLHVWTMQPDGSSARRITGQGSWAPLGWSANTAQLLVERLNHRLDDDGLALMSAAGSQPKILDPDAGFGGASWRPGET